MRNVLIICLLSPLIGMAQFNKEGIKKGFDEREIYVSLNPFSIAEPQFAFGPSAGIRYSERSEVFAEAAWVTRSPFYEDNDYLRLRGARFLFQYRYHFLQEWRPLFPFGSMRRKIRERHQPFVAIEGRLKPLSFESYGEFINSNTGDTLRHYRFAANSFTIAWSLLFGHSFNLSADERWKLEFTAGFGVRQRYVNLKTVPKGYEAYTNPRKPWILIPAPEDAYSGPQFPVCFRLRRVLK